MGTPLRCAVVLGLCAGLGLPAGAQSPRCTTDRLRVDGVAIAARFCAASEPGTANLSVTETFTAAGKTIAKTTSLAVVAGASTSRTIDDIDLGPLGAKHTLHMTLASSGGGVVHEHALALPGAIPVK